MKTRTILPILVLAVLAWLPGSALADTFPRVSCSSSASAFTPPRPSFAVSNYTMTAFGETFKTTASIQQRYTFAGRETSANAGAPMFYRNRQYSPMLGRFGRRDPRLGGDALFNAYSFPGNNSIAGVDPFGLYCCVISAEVVKEGKFKGSKSLKDYYPENVPEDNKDQGKDQEKDKDKDKTGGTRVVIYPLPWGDKPEEAGPVETEFRWGYKLQLLGLVEGTDSNCTYSQFYKVTETNFPREKVSEEPIDDYKEAKLDPSKPPKRQEFVEGKEKKEEKKYVSYADFVHYGKYGKKDEEVNVKTVTEYASTWFSKCEGEDEKCCKNLQCYAKWTYTLEVQNGKVATNKVEVKTGCAPNPKYKEEKQ